MLQDLMQILPNNIISFDLASSSFYKAYETVKFLLHLQRTVPFGVQPPINGSDIYEAREDARCKKIEQRAFLIEILDQFPFKFIESVKTRERTIRLLIIQEGNVLDSGDEIPERFQQNYKLLEDMNKDMDDLDNELNILFKQMKEKAKKKRDVRLAEKATLVPEEQSISSFNARI